MPLCHYATLCGSMHYVQASYHMRGFQRSDWNLHKNWCGSKLESFCQFATERARKQDKQKWKELAPFSGLTTYQSASFLSQPVHGLLMKHLVASFVQQWPKHSNPGQTRRERLELGCPNGQRPHQVHGNLSHSVEAVWASPACVHPCSYLSLSSFWRKRFVFQLWEHNSWQPRSKWICWCHWSIVCFPNHTTTAEGPE